MKVLLIKDLKSVGKKGEIKEVSDGYGANYVIPQGYGRQLNEATLKEYYRDQQQIKEKEAAEKAEAEKAAQRLGSMEAVFYAKAGKSGAMIGTISLKAVEEKLKADYGIIIDKRKFIDHFPINAFGLTKLRIELYKDVIGTISVRVLEQKE